MRLGDIGFFPDEKGARIIWIGLEPIYDTIELQRRIDKMLAHWFEKDARFYPHMTIVRLRVADDIKELVGKTKGLRFEKKEFQVNEFKLYKSALTPEGPVYEVISVFQRRD